jgi:Ca2+-binding EF-hand superfamily protein
MCKMLGPYGITGVALALLLASLACAGSAIEAIDSDNDGTLDMAEVETAGATIFAALDKDKEGTLDASELAGRLSTEELQDLDSNRSGTLDRNEYAKAVAIRFRNADADGNGTLDAREVGTPDGAALLKLVQ